MQSQKFLQILTRRKKLSPQIFCTIYFGGNMRGIILG